ncbi:uncharacterized protein PFL1_03314 [Pseudozyma flocculosa PF-1]|uniref:Chitin-binding type-4 domain-containing protein n=2 Tax=Pseudozyma flocculosa TaxID=84751 RepID=A0A5C3F6E2_9BASI|nr:uncharacterized protein PFL1_03314 [Pseudozyma flocculosa PF-1]EPQ29024.1 hypothetical protein PFL1_03314 [Pseudozyma flocculosa PF-1]SPO40018.1 uncharacterized protein PSFLO_05500 [Pseudozyma flocculosa]
MRASSLFFASLSSSLLYAVQVTAHGYLASPPSRAALCKADGSPTACGAIQYEPQSVEAPKGLPFARTGDGHLCSAGVDRFPELDRQGPNAWKHQQPSDTFKWNILVPHSTTDFKYFITKDGWNSAKSQGLSASDLESTPFLQVKMDGKEPTGSVVHKANQMPKKSGYHMVYAVWTIADTGNAFYQCLDLDFGGGHSVSSSNSNGVASVGGNQGASSASSSSSSSAAAANSQEGGEGASSASGSQASASSSSSQHADSAGAHSNSANAQSSSGSSHAQGQGKPPASKGRQHFAESNTAPAGASSMSSSDKKARCRRRAQAKRSHGGPSFAVLNNGGSRMTRRSAAKRPQA